MERREAVVRRERRRALSGGLHDAGRILSAAQQFAMIFIGRSVWRKKAL